MAAIRYGIAGQPVDHSLSPLLMALVARHLALLDDDKHLTMEVIGVDSIQDALAWGYAGAVPEPIPWIFTTSVFGKFRTRALIKKAVDAASEINDVHPKLLPKTEAPFVSKAPHSALPTRMFAEEIWLNLTAPLKHQLDSGAVAAIDDSMANKCVNALRWDGRGWWCAGLDGLGVVEVMSHHGITPDDHVLGLIGGGGAARSTAAAWTKRGGRVRSLASRRALDDGPWLDKLTEVEHDAVVDFDNEGANPNATLFLKSSYRPMQGTVEERVNSISGNILDGRWLLVAQHLACWRQLWAPERVGDLPSLGLLLTQLLEAECVLSSYA
tara:strand:+ start:6860 stop:7837 length:978 start_codon:yes stop_codon:yes gene_type:complete